MNHQDPNVLGVEMVAQALGDLMQDLVLIGGCTVGLLITDKAAAPVRQTIDVDLIAEVGSTVEYYALCERMKEQGFSEAPDADHMCRYVRGALKVDLMPSSSEILGHSTNEWYPAAVRSATKVVLPSSTEILVVAPPLFLATKLAAFYGRGQGDYFHHDMEDIINVIDGRPELVEEVRAASFDVREYLQTEFDDLLADHRFVDTLPGYLRSDAASQARFPAILERIRRLAGL